MALPPNIQQSLANQERDLLTKGQRLGRFDRIRQREFYSSYLFAPGFGNTIPAGRYEIFKVLRGEIGQGWPVALTERETNWTGKGRVPDNINLVLKSFHASIIRPPSTPIYDDMQEVDISVPVHSADVTVMAYGCLLAVQYLTNTIPIGYLADFPGIGGGFGWNGASRQAPDAALPGVSVSLNAAGAKSNLPLTSSKTCPAFERRQRIGVLLQHGEQFSMVLIVPRSIRLLARTSWGETAYGNDATGMIEVRVGFWGTESFVERS